MIKLTISVIIAIPISEPVSIASANIARLEVKYAVISFIKNIKVFPIKATIEALLIVFDLSSNIIVFEFIKKNIQEQDEATSYFILKISYLNIH